MGARSVEQRMRGRRRQVCVGKAIPEHDGGGKERDVLRICTAYEASSGTPTTNTISGTKDRLRECEAYLSRGNHLQQYRTIANHQQ